MEQRSDFLVWGSNQLNLLSKSQSQCLSTPVALSLPFNIASICASQKHISFLTKQGELYSYGSNLDGRLGISSKNLEKVPFTQPVRVDVADKIIRAQSGFSHMCVLTQKLKLYSWGLGDYGALGTGQFKSKNVPTSIDLPFHLISKIRQISCGAMHTAFLFDDGSVYTCGSNQYGQLGINKPEKVSTPVPISFHLPVHQVSCGVFYTLLLTREGKVYGMGNNKYGQLGTGHKVNQFLPTLIKQLSDIVKVTAGYHSGAIDKFGNLYIWGSGTFGQILRPKKFVLSVPIKDIAIRGFFGVAIGHTSKYENRIYSWGNNTFGELGLGNYQAQKQPQQIQTLRGLQINKIALGVNFALVLLHSREIQSRYTQQIQQQVDKKNSFSQQSMSGLQQKLSDRKSVIGFQQKYLYLNKQKQDYSAQKNNKSERRRKYQQQFSKIQKSFERSNQNQHDKSIKSKKKQGQNFDKHNKNKQTAYQPVSSHNNLKNTNQNRYLTKNEAPPQRNNQEDRDYQRLFVQLSQDYENLVAKYINLQKQIEDSKIKERSQSKLAEKQRTNYQEILGLKNQLAKLSYDNLILREQAKQIKRCNDEILRDNEKLLTQQARNSVVTLCPPYRSMQNQVQKQYNRLLNQKQQLINKLNLSLQKSEQTFQSSIKKLSQQNLELRDQLNNQYHKNRKIINEHQCLIDQLDGQIKKYEQRYVLLKQQNDDLKDKYTMQNIQFQGLKNAQIKYNETSQKQSLLKQKYQNSLKQSVLKDEYLTNRIAQLQVELNYEKQFNRKYENSIRQIKQDNQKLHQQINLQIDTNLQKQGRVQNLKLELQKFKKYKKQLDEKNIDYEQIKHNFEDFKKKSKELLGQKQKQLKFHLQTIDKNQKVFQQNLQRKNLQAIDLQKQISRMQKEISKSKEAIILNRNQLQSKDDQIQNLNLQRQNLEKKNNILSNQLNKQVDQRQSILKQFGEAKRQLSKLKLIVSQNQSKLQLQIEQKNKAVKGIAFRDQQLNTLKSQIDQMEIRCENLRKQNIQYKQQLENTSFQLQNQLKLNQQLARANREFAQSEQQLDRKINDLQSKIYELQNQNKSYTPRYQALLLRNKQLDQRNRQLGEMINKAIQIQAQSYKNNILKQVQISTDNIINQFKQQQEIQFRGRRNKNKSKQLIISQPQVNKINLQNIKKEKKQPYTQMMNDRITQHKRKVSESAQKLANILELNDKGASQIDFHSGRHNTQDYQKINSKMESFNNQKQQFMTKIHSFAQKLKII